MNESESDAERPELDPPLLPHQCGARKRKGGICRAPKMPNGKCRLHGGASPAPGPGHPNFRHGKYSTAFQSAMPPRLQARFEEALNDPHLMELRKFIAYYDSQVLESLERYTKSDAGQYRQQLLDAWGQFKKVNAEPTESPESRAAKGDRIARIFNEIDAIIAKGADEVAARAEVDAAIKNRVGVTSVEQRRLLESQESLSVVEAMTLVVNLHTAVKRHIQDKATLRAIGADFQRLINIERHQPPQADSRAFDHVDAVLDAPVLATNT